MRRGQRACGGDVYGEVHGKKSDKVQVIRHHCKIVSVTTNANLPQSGRTSPPGQVNHDAPVELVFAADRPPSPRSVGGFGM